MASTTLPMAACTWCTRGRAPCRQCRIWWCTRAGVSFQVILSYVRGSERPTRRARLSICAPGSPVRASPTRCSPRSCNSGSLRPGCSPSGSMLRGRSATYGICGPRSPTSGQARRRWARSTSPECAVGTALRSRTASACGETHRGGVATSTVSGTAMTALCSSSRWTGCTISRPHTGFGTCSVNVPSYAPAAGCCGVPTSSCASTPPTWSQTSSPTVSPADGVRRGGGTGRSGTCWPRTPHRCTRPWLQGWLPCRGSR